MENYVNLLVKHYNTLEELTDFIDELSNLFYEKEEYQERTTVNIFAFDENECDNKIYNKGELRDYDLQFFTLNEKVRNYVLKHTENESGILYQFHFYNARKEKIIIGWIFEQNKQFDMFVNCPHWYIKFEKYESVIDTCLNILKEKEGIYNEG